jgi:hypothetical protein
MVALLFTLALASMLVIGGTAVSLFLYTRSLSEVNHARHERKLHPTTVDYATENPFSIRASAASNEMSRYTRNGLVILLFGLVVAAMVIASIVNGLMR